MKFLKILDKVLYSSFLLVFALYVGKFGMANFIVPYTGTWSMMLNLGIWFILMSVCIREIFPEPEEEKKVRFK